MPSKRELDQKAKPSPMHADTILSLKLGAPANFTRAGASPVSAAAADLRDPPPDFLSGGGEMGALMRAMDWRRSPLGPPEGWPDALKMSVSICLNSRFPILLWWGPELVTLYNDAWRPVAGDTKHPSGLGRPGVESWADIWNVIGPQLRGVLERGEATWSKDLQLFLDRYGYLEETYFTYAYSPIRETGGAIGGVFSAVYETTEQVLGTRRLELLRALGEVTAEARNEAGTYAAIAAILAAAPDIGFATIHMRDAAGAVILAATTLPPDLLPEMPDAGAWQLDTVLKTGIACLEADLGVHARSLPGAWPEPVTQAIKLPILAQGHHGAIGVLTVGLNPRRRMDDAYSGFLGLVAQHVSGAIAAARAYDEERRRAEALTEVDRAKTAFFANVSHEFRTPLTLLLGPLEEQLADPLLPDVARERAASAHRNALRLLRLVNTLLDFSRAEAGRAAADLRPADMAALTADLASSFRSLCAQAGLMLEVDCPPLPRPVMLDGDMWEKVVLNLLSNAFKFTHEGKIQVSVRPSPDGGGAELAVEDSGTGIPAHELPKLFERFHRVEGARGRSHEGTGIGLALVRDLVRLHGGDVSVRSAMGRGSVFTVSIPWGRATARASDADAAPGTQQAVRGAAGRAAAFVGEAARWLPAATEPVPRPPMSPDAATRPLVLVADDNADMRSYVGRLLEPHYEVAFASDGLEALDLALSLRPALVLSDVMMPGLDGLALTARLRADARTTTLPVVLLSARAGEEARVAGLATGADDYLVKPFPSRELLARLEAALRLSRLRTEAEARLRFALDAGRLGNWELDLTTGMTERSLRHDLIFGYPEGASVWSYEVFLGHVEAQDRPAVEAGFAAATQTGAAWHFEARIRRADGQSRWIEASGSPRRGPDGRIDRLFGVVADITERRQLLADLDAERARLHAVFEAVPVGLVLGEAPSGRIIGGNKQAEAIFGHAVLPSSDIEAYREWVSFHPDGRQVEGHEYPLARVITGEEERPEMEVLYRRGDGTDSWVRLVASPVRDASGDVVGGVVAGLDVDREKRAIVALEAARDGQRLLIAELNHRVKNTLATVQSLAQQTQRSAPEPREFAEAFGVRLRGLADAHDLLTREAWEGATLGDVAEAALQAWLHGGRVRITGPHARLVPKQALALSMALGELVTNAAKHGSLSGDEGRVCLTWEIGRHEDGANMAVMAWREEGGPVVHPPARRGLGSRLLGKPLASELGGSLDLVFAPEGVRCALSFPVEAT